MNIVAGLIILPSHQCTEGSTTRSAKELCINPLDETTELGSITRCEVPRAKGLTCHEDALEHGARGSLDCDMSRMEGVEVAEETKELTTKTQRLTLSMAYVQLEQPAKAYKECLSATCKATKSQEHEVVKVGRQQQEQATASHCNNQLRTATELDHYTLEAKVQAEDLHIDSATTRLAEGNNRNSLMCDGSEELTIALPKIFGTQERDEPGRNRADDAQGN